MTTTSLLGRTVVAFIGLVTAFVMIGGTAVLPANGQLTSTQIQSILGLLQSFGADQATINNVNAALTGQPTTGGGSGSGSTGGACYNFTRSLHMDMSPKTGADVTALQNYLTATGHYTYSGGSTGYFGAITKAAVSAWQTANGISPTAGYFGPASQAKYNTMCGGTSGSGTGTTVPVSGSLSVSLSASSPAQGAVISGQGIANLGAFVFVNGANTEAKITKVTLNKAYISNDTAYSNVYIYDGGKRLTDSASVTNGVITFNDSAGLFMIPAGGSRTLSIRVDVASTATGQVMGVSLTGVESNVPVAGAFPITAAAQSVAGATLATVDFNTTTEPSATANVEPNNDVRLWQNTVSISQHKVKLAAMSFRNTGSAQNNELINFDLYVNGNLVASVPSMDSDRYVRFDFSNNPILLDTGSAIIKLEGDIVGGASRTYDFELRTTGDAIFYDNELGAAVISTANGSTFSARSGGVQTIASSTGGSVTVSKANNSPTDNVSTGASSVKLATFQFRASGERMKIENLDVNAGTASGNEGGLDNGKVYVNGSQVGSTKDLTEATDVNFTFGSSFIIEPGQTATVDIYADTKTTTGTNLLAASTVTITVGAGSSNAQGMSSLQTTNVPASDTAANTITVASATASVTKYTAYGNQTTPAGTNNMRLGSMVISSGSTEGVNVNNITIALSTTEAGTITNMRLVDNATGVQLGTTSNSPSTSNSYSVNISIPKSGTKTIDIFGDVRSGAGIGDFQATFDSLTGNGTTTASSVSVTDDTALQTITIGSGTLTLSRGAGDPSNSNIVAGAAGSGVKIGEYRFSAQNSSFTVNELKLEIANGVASAVSALVIEYKDANGDTNTAEQSLVITTPGTNDKATATFTGLSIYVPSNGDATVSVKAKTVAISGSNAALSGASINVSMDFDTGFKATDSSGSTSSSVGSADLASNGTHYMKKTVPTFSKVTLSGTPVSGQPVYRFTIAADAAGDVEFKKLSFNVSTTGVTLTGLYLRETGQTTALNDTNPDALTSGVLALTVGTQTAPLDDDVISIAAGESKTLDLVATTIAGWSMNDNITISLGDDTAAVANAASASVSGSPKITWSDRSRSAHTTATADWTNAYLLKDFSSDSQSWSYGS